MNEKVKLLNEYYDGKAIICPNDDEDVLSVVIVKDFCLNNDCVFVNCSSIVDISDDLKIDIYDEDDDDETRRIELDEKWTNCYAEYAEKKLDEFLVTEEGYLEMCGYLRDMNSYIGKSSNKISKLIDYEDCEDLYSEVSYDKFHGSFVLFKNDTASGSYDINNLKSLKHTFVSFVLDGTSYVGRIVNTKFNKNTDTISLKFDFVYIIETDDLYCIDNFTVDIESDYVNSFFNNIDNIKCDLEEIKKAWVALDLFDMNKKLKFESFLSDVRNIFEEEYEETDGEDDDYDEDEDEEYSYELTDDMYDDFYDDLFINSFYFQDIDKQITVEAEKNLMKYVKKFYASGNYNKLEDYIHGWGITSNNYYNVDSFFFEFIDFDREGGDYATLYIPIDGSNEFFIEYKKSNSDILSYVTKDRNIDRLCNIIYKVVNDEIVTREDGHIKILIPNKKLKDKKILNLYIDVNEEYYGMKFDRTKIRLTHAIETTEDMNKQLNDLTQ